MENHLIVAIKCCECGQTLAYAAKPTIIASAHKWHCYLCMHNIVDLSDAIGANYLANKHDLYEIMDEDMTARENCMRWRQAIIKFCNTLRGN